MSWPGGKDGAGVFQRLVNQIPPHDVFVSAFLGDCPLLRKMQRATLSIGIDLDRSNVERWRVKECGALILHANAIAWLRSAAAGGGFGGDGNPLKWFVYLDPPYLIKSRSSQKRLYDHELTTPEEHAELLDVVASLPCQAMISHYPCEQYDQALAGWRSFTFRSMTRGGKWAIEKVWCNYPEPTELHDSRWYGGDKREREKLARRDCNLVNKLLRMPPRERQRIMDAVRDRATRK